MPLVIDYVSFILLGIGIAMLACALWVWFGVMPEARKLDSLERLVRRWQSDEGMDASDFIDRIEVIMSNSTG